MKKNLYLRIRNLKYYNLNRGQGYWTPHIMKTYIGVEIERNPLSGNIEWISPKMIFEKLFEDDFKTTMKGKKEIISVKDEVYDNALLKYNSIYDKLVDPYNFIFIPKEEFNNMTKCFFEKYHQY